MTNEPIRLAAKNCGVRLWEIAEKLGISDSSFSRKLRRELPDDQTSRILSIIDEISSGREVSGYRT